MLICPSIKYKQKYVSFDFLAENFKLKLYLEQSNIISAKLLN